VSSFTVMPRGDRREAKLAVISAARAFIGATYTILNWSSVDVINNIEETEGEMVIIK
jgi:hypothetical protein